MKKTLICISLALAFLFGAAAQAGQVKYLDSDREPSFAKDASLLKLYVINTHGASDAIVLWHDGKTMVIDCGDTRYGSLYVKPVLDMLGVDHVEFAYNTHPHDDHINGFLSLFNEVSVDKFYTAFPLNYCAEQTNVMKSAMEHGVEIVPVTNESDISFGALRIRLYQDMNYVTTVAASANNASMVMHITYGDCTLMITGDAGKEVYTDMYADWNGDMQSDIFKVPHHGYNYPSLEMLDVIAPKYALVTNNNSDKIASIATVFRNKGIPILYAGKGTIEVMTDGTSWAVRQLAN